MPRPDDFSLNPEDLRVVEERAKKLLDRAGAWHRFPTPVDDILAAACVRVASTSAFDPDAIVAYLRGKAAKAQSLIKSALSKVFGLYDSGDEVIHIDESVVVSKQTFLKLHETGHHVLPTHRKVFRFFQDCEMTLAPDVADQFEREANNFARYVLFQGRGFAEIAADYSLAIRTPLTLAKKFGASVYASAREFVRTHQRPCLLYVLEPIELATGVGAQAVVRRIECSPAFEDQFGKPTESRVTLDHALGPVLPIGKRMTRPAAILLTDKNGILQECMAEAFDSSYNIFVLVYPIRALTGSMIVVPRKAMKTGNSGTHRVNTRTPRKTTKVT